MIAGILIISFLSVLASFVVYAAMVVSGLEQNKGFYSHEITAEGRNTLTGDLNSAVTDSVLPSEAIQSSGKYNL